MAGSGDRDRTHHLRRAALAHSLREKVLRMLLDGEGLRADEIARRRKQTLGRTLYHLKVLHRRRALVARAGRRPSATVYKLLRAGGLGPQNAG